MNSLITARTLETQIQKYISLKDTLNMKYLFYRLHKSMINFITTASETRKTHFKRSGM